MPLPLPEKCNLLASGMERQAVLEIGTKLLMGHADSNLKVNEGSTFLKCLYVPTKLQGVTSQKTETITITAVRTSNLIG
jgi:hypothetical protein